MRGPIDTLLDGLHRFCVWLLILMELLPLLAMFVQPFLCG